MVESSKGGKKRGGKQLLNEEEIKVAKENDSWP
jgi:hypothetical protein